MLADRDERRHLGDRRPDQRTQAQRDRDRVLYASALRRLSGVTQVVTPSEHRVFHNRLTHTLKVAQVGRRLAEVVLKDPRSGPELAEELGGVDPEVVEAAALAHDLGHPPFGHIAEDELNDLVGRERYADGFEGNAQSFRIVTKLAVRHIQIPGLNLTRATLSAILKYPWLYQPGKDKWGAYSSEEPDLLFARHGRDGTDMARTLEAQLMDWADDVTYAIHDVEDFYRAGLIPLDRVVSDKAERRRFMEKALPEVMKKSEFSEDDLTAAFERVVNPAPITAAYRGGRMQRAHVRSFTAGLIDRCVSAVTLRRPSTGDSRLINIEPVEVEMEVKMFKALTRHYVINNPTLATQQYGQRSVIRELYRMLKKEACANPDEQAGIFPEPYQEELGQAGNDEERTRVVVDLIASLTDQQALQLHHRLKGIDPGSVMDVVIP